MRDHPPSSKFQAPSSHLSGGGKRILVLPILLISASLVVAQNPPAQVVHVALSTHDHTTTVGSPTELREAFADAKSPGGIPGVPVALPTGVFWIPGERFTYTVGSIEVTNTRISPKFSGVDVKVPFGASPFSQVNARQVAILQMTDAFQKIVGPTARPVTGQSYFYGTVPNATEENSGNSTNARGISVWPNDDPAETRIAICGETNDKKIPRSQYENGWPAWSSNSPHWSGFIAVFDGNCDLLWSHQFFGRAEDGECAITDVSIRVVGEGAQAQDVVTYCGISSHGVDLDANGPTPANNSLLPVGWFQNYGDGAINNGAGQWDGIVGRLTNSHTSPTTPNGVSNAQPVVHAVVGGSWQDGLFGIAELPEYEYGPGAFADRFVVVGSTGTGGTVTGTNSFPFSNPPTATSSNYSLGTTLVFTLFPAPLLFLEASSPIGSSGSTMERFTCARDVAVQLDAVRADPAHGVTTPTHVIYVVGSTDDEDLFLSVGATATSQTLINGIGNPGGTLPRPLPTDGFLLAARDLPLPPSPSSVMFQKGSYHGSIYDDGLCGVACWNEYLDHVAVSGFWSVYTGPTTPPATDLEAATYFHDTTATQSTANPVVVSNLLRIRRDNIVAAGSQVPAAMGQNNATTSLPFAEHDLGSPAGGGIAIEDRARINIVGKTPAGFPYLVWPPTSPEARGYLGNVDAVRTSLDMVPDFSQFVGVGRTDGTGQNVPIVGGANGGTTPTTNLSNYGRQINVTPPGLQRIMIDWEGGLNNPCAVLVDRPPFGSNIVAAFLHYGIPANPLPFFTHPLMPGVALWTDPLDPLTTSISQIFFPGTDQSVRFPLTLPPGTGHVYVVQAVCMLSNSTFAGSPGMVFRF